MPDGDHNGIVLDAEFVASPAAAMDFSAPDPERVVLAAVMLDEGNALGVWRRLSALITARHFSNPRHSTIWASLGALHDRGEAVDIVTLVAELRTRNRLDAVGGPQYLGDLTEFIPVLANCETHARLVVKAAARRDLAVLGSRLATASDDGARDPFQLCDLAIEALRRMRLGFGGGVRASNAEELVTAMWKSIEDGQEGKTPGPLPFGVPTLDRMSDGGMKRGGCYFLAARPGIGKTSLAAQVSGAASESGDRVLYVALEPSRLDVIQAISANRAGVGLTKISRAPKTLTQGDIDSLMNVSQAIVTWPLHVVDTTESGCPDTVAKIEAVMRSLPSMPALVVVDHLLKVNAVGRYDKPHVGTAEVVGALVALGKRTGATVLCLCHIGRAMSTTSGLFRRPRAEDITGGDAMNRDADGIIVLHREDKYPTKKENVGDPLLAGHIDLFAPKLRGVEDNTFGRMRFRGDVQRFEEFVTTPNAPELDSSGFPVDLT